METTTEKNTPTEYIEPNPTEEEIQEQIEVMEKVEQAIEETDKKVWTIQLNYTWTIIHKWFARDDVKQKMVQYAYKLWGMDFVKLIECENGNWNPKAVGDSGKAFWLCQMNTNYHKLPDDYKDNRVVQVEYCYKKWSQWTKYYWPSRKIKWVKCSTYVENRFILEN